MPFNGSGSFSRTFPPGGWQGDAAANIKIKADRHDQHDADLATGLSNTICRDGQTTISADIPFNSKKITGLANPVSAQDAATKAYVDAFPNGSTQTLVSTDAGAGYNPVLLFDRNSASPAANDALGIILFRGKDSTNAVTDYASIYGGIVDPLNTVEDGNIGFNTMVAGSSTQRMTLGPTGLNMNVNQGNLTFVKRGRWEVTGGVTLHADTRVFHVEVMGGGGAGGGGQAGGAGMGSCGGGGGGGGYITAWYIRTATIGTGMSVTIGAGGIGVSQGTGGAGGGTGFTPDGGTTNITAGGGGGGGTTAASSLVAAVGALGGTGSGGGADAYLFAGEDGGLGEGAFSTANGVMYVRGGKGADSRYGQGGREMYSVSSTHGGFAGAGAIGYGAGGAGAGATVGGATGGGNGSQGILIITEYK